MIPGVSASFSPQSQRTLQARLMRANSCAKAPVKAGRGPVVQRIRINDRRNFAAVKGEFYFWPLIVKRSITAPGPLRLYLVDSSAEFCNEPCIEITSHPNKQRALRERTRHRNKTIEDSRSLGCYTSARPQKCRTVVGLTARSSQFGAVWRGDHDEPIVYIYRSGRKSGTIHGVRCRSAQ